MVEKNRAISELEKGILETAATIHIEPAETYQPESIHDRIKREKERIQKQDNLTLQMFDEILGTIGAYVKSRQG